jgi:hypothetical protein
MKKIIFIIQLIIIFILILLITIKITIFITQIIIFKIYDPRTLNPDQESKRIGFKNRI